MSTPHVDDIDIRAAIAPKSDQINADDLIAGPITATVEKVKRGKSQEQPWDIHITGYKPWRPCKGMRRVLVELWGEDPAAWIGRSLRLYRAPEVTWASEAVGGIRISGMSDLKASCTVSVTVSRGKKVPMRVEKLTPQRATTTPPVADPLPGFRDALSKAGLDADAVCAFLADEGIDLTADRAALGALYKRLQPGGDLRARFDTAVDAEASPDAGDVYDAKPAGDEGGAS